MFEHGSGVGVIVQRGGVCVQGSDSWHHLVQSTVGEAPIQ